MRFHFELGDTVVIDASGEKGEVIGRAEYIASSNQYYVRYKNAQGVAVEQWWAEEALRRP